LNIQNKILFSAIVTTFKVHLKTELFSAAHDTV